MSNLTGAHLVARCLKLEGVEKIFTLVGDHILPLVEALYNEGFHIVDTRHESAAVHMADAWARVTGRPGVVLVTGGPGHANAIPGLTVSYTTETPVIFLSGFPPLAQKGMPAFQEIPQVEMAAPITKGAWMVPDARRVPEFVANAFRVATAGRPGPTHLTIPIDVQEKTVGEEDLPRYQPWEYRPSLGPLAHPKLVRQAVALLHQAQRPVVIVGGPARFQLSGELLQRFVEATRLPVFTVELARGMVSDDHPLCFGYADTSLNGAAKLFSQADVVLLLGKSLDSRISFGRVFPPQARIIQVDPSPAEVGRNRGVAVGIVGHIGAVVEQLAQEAAARRWTEKPWLAELRQARQDWQEKIRANATDDLPMHAIRLYSEVEPFLDEDTFIVFDGGDFVQWGRSYLKARKEGHWLRLGPLAHLGAGLPFALTCRLVDPRAKVFLFTGDGSIGFYLAEFDTAVRHRLPFVTIMGNDTVWGIDRQYQIAYYGKSVGTDLRWTRYDKVVEALDGHGELVERPEEVRPAVERALASGKPSLVNVRIKSVASPLAQANIARRLGQAGRG